VLFEITHIKRGKNVKISLLRKFSSQQVDMKIFLILSVIFQISTTKTFESYSKVLESVIDVFLVKEKIIDFEILIYCQQKREKWKINKILS
jgi:hypothetical protein